jgi:hypothetical protein
MPTPPPQPPWQARARCRSYPTPDDFFPDPFAPTPSPGLVAALACCRPCPVADVCLQEGITGGEAGVWGGLTEPERVIVAAQGWRLGQPIPHPRVTRTWVTLAQAAATLGVPRRRVRGWAEAERVDSTFAPLHYGQPTRLVDLDQCRTHLEAA